MNLHRLYIVTGKGGVGKSTLSLALSHHLKKLGENVLYIAQDNSEMSLQLREQLNIPSEYINSLSATEEYIARKLNSKIIAAGIMKASFLGPLVNMLPGLSYLIFLGKVIDQLQQDPTLRIVFDSPSSGHAITMFDSLQNFRNIFKSGILVKDIEKMLEFISSPYNLKAIIATVPTMMAMHESIELKEQLSSLGINNSQIILNNCFSSMAKIESEDLPLFLNKKIALELEVLSKFSNLISFSLPHSYQLSKLAVIEEIEPLMSMGGK